VNSHSELRTVFVERGEDRGGNAAGRKKTRDGARGSRRDGATGGFPTGY